MRVLRGRWERPLNRLAVGAGYVAAASWADGTRNDAEVWDLATGAVCHAHPIAEAGGGSLAFAPDGRTLYVAEAHRVAAWDTPTGEPRPGPAPALDFPDVALSADGRRLVTAEHRGESGLVQCWDPGGGAFRREWAAGPHRFRLFGPPAVGPDGARVAVSACVLAARPRRTLEVWDGASGRPLRRLDLDPADPVRQLVFTADGARLLARVDGRAVRVYDAGTLAPAGELSHKGRAFVTGLAVRPGGPWVLTTRTDGTARFWDPATLREARTFDWRLGPLLSAAFGPDGTLAAAGTADGRVVVWDVDG